MNNHPEQLNTEEWDKQIEKMSMDFNIAHSVMIITNNILEPLKLPPQQRQLENDRVDGLIKSIISKAITNERARIIKLIKHNGLHLGYANDIINQINKD